MSQIFRTILLMSKDRKFLKKKKLTPAKNKNNNVLWHYFRNSSWSVNILKYLYYNLKEKSHE